MSKDAKTLTQEAKLFAGRAAEVAAVQALLAKVLARTDAWNWDDSTGQVVALPLQRLKDALSTSAREMSEFQEYLTGVSTLKAEEAEYA